MIPIANHSTEMLAFAQSVQMLTSLQDASWTGVFTDMENDTFEIDFAQCEPQAASAALQLLQAARQVLLAVSYMPTLKDLLPAHALPAFANVANRLGFSEQMLLIAANTKLSPKEKQHKLMLTAAKLLEEDYKNNPELTIFTSLDKEPVYEA